MGLKLIHVNKMGQETFDTYWLALVSSMRWNDPVYKQTSTSGGGGAFFQKHILVASQAI